MRKNSIYWLYLGFLGLGLSILGLWLLLFKPGAYQIIDTFAGTGKPGYSGDGGPAREAQFFHPRGIAVDKAGNLYIADTENHRVRKIEITTDDITTVAGCEIGKDEVCEIWDKANSRDDTKIQATQIQLNMPSDVAIDNAGHLYILDHTRHRIYQVDTNGFIKSFAGNGKIGYSGDGGLATNASINASFAGIAVDNQRNLYIADRDNHRIRKVDSNGIISTIVGNGSAGYSGDGDIATKAQLFRPEDMALDNDGNLYIADSYNGVIRKVDTAGIITTIAGIAGTGKENKYSGDGGLATEATLLLPTEVLPDNLGNLYIVDFRSHRILQIDQNGIIRSIAGNGESSYGGDGGDATKASLNNPDKLAFVRKPHKDSIELYISDHLNSSIRKITWLKEPNPNGGNDIIKLLLVFSIFTLLVGIGFVSYYLRWYLHPIVQILSADSSKLLTIPLEQLPKAKELLQRTDRLDTVLANNDVSQQWLEKAIHFATLSNAQRCAWLASRLMAEQMGTAHADTFELLLSETFPLRLESCLVYFPAADSTEVKSLLEQKMGSEVTVVISLEASQQAILRPMGENLANLSVVPNQRELTTLLLSPKPIEAFVRLLASQLKMTQISLYQTQRGVTKDSGFFGRENILAQILYSEPKNYVIVGGRKTGKTSMLKKIERHYQNDPRVDCLYVCLACDNLQPLYGQLGLPTETDLLTLGDKLADVPTGQRRLVLLDEADLLIRKEIANDYTALKHFRALSENGQCYFIMAGFWYLYEAAVSRYYSPLNNFGESIRIGALEYDACQDLATQPMTLLGIRYAYPDLVKKIITATGQRANLVAITCHELVTQLSSHQRALNQEDIQQAFDNENMREALAGWVQLSDDEQIDRLARIIVYSTIEAGEFGLTEVMEVLNAHDSFKYTTVELNNALTCLELAYIIQYKERDRAGNNDKHRYCYCVPLFREWLLRQEVAALLEQEFRN